MSSLLILQDRGAETEVFRQRVLAVLVAMVLLLLALVVRLVKLQVIDHEHYTTLSQDNRLKIVPVAPTRGLIYSQEGVLLADNRPSFSLEVVPERVHGLDRALEALRSVVTISDDDLSSFRRELHKKRRFEGVPLRANLSEEEVARFSVERHRFPGIDIVARLSRYYPLGPEMIHIVGYVGRIDEAELKAVDPSNYSATHYIGKSGVERSYEGLLHGRVGYQEVEVNAEGRVLRIVRRTAPEPGRDLHLNISVKLQRAALEALSGRRGAVVAMDPRDGGVLALASTPTHDPNAFVGGISVKHYRYLRDLRSRPLFNRALQGQYPPGSTIKPFMGLAGLTYGVRTAGAGSWCPGWFSLRGQDHRYRCWKKTGHGTLDLSAAIAQSCDVYFYRLANDLGINRMHHFLNSFGFGRPSGIDLPGESAGLMPSKAWKRKVRKAAWYPGETVITGIGQGYVLATPVQLAHATAMLAASGRALRPRVASHAVDPVSHAQTHFRGQQGPGGVNMRPAQRTEIFAAMEEVVHGARGTAQRVGRGAPYRMAGKTGTAQVFGIKQGQSVNEKRVPQHLRDHALFIAFAPVEDPKIVVSALVENGGHGSEAAAPIARRLMDLHLASMPPDRRYAGGHQ